MEFEIVIEEAVIESIYMHPLGEYKWSKGTAKDKWYFILKKECVWLIICMRISKKVSGR